MPRVGTGYDVHRLVVGRPLVLGGVTIPHSLGLDGHSDADVLVHAIMDAILGAAAMGDIGQHFPPSDPRYAGASSIGLLRTVRQMIEERGWRVENVDATVMAEAPRLAPYVEEMRRRIGEAIGLETSSIGIKATTNEGLGFIGRGEGIAALAVAMLDNSSPTL